MQEFKNKKIVLGVCGGIASYKSIQLVRDLTQLGAVVRVVMTASAKQFISPMVFQALSGHEVRSELFDLNAEQAMGHIELARWADFLLIAPASANCLAKFSHGIADDLLSTLYLVTEAAVVVCPAMNRCMWHHQATQSNCKQLAERGVVIVGPDEGAQACGEVGPGRMSEVNTIISALRLYDVSACLQGKTVMITAGPTREAIDPVRYLSNRSSGKMGYALAEAALKAKAHVLLISGPTALSPPKGVQFYSVTSANEMQQVVANHLIPGMIFIGAAAVSDYHIAHPKEEKIKKRGNEPLTLQLVPNPDIVRWVVDSHKAFYVVGFAAETSNVLENARIKLTSKQLNLIIANQVGDNIGFDSDVNQVTIVTKHDELTLPAMHKTKLAGKLIEFIASDIQRLATTS